jgi:putative ABC transport system permease protein
MQRNLVHALRSVMASKANTAINVAGLSIAVAAFLLLMHYVSFEKSFEKFHSKADRISRVTIDLYNGPEMIGTDCETYPALGPALLKEFPEVESFVRLQDYSPVEIRDSGQVVALDKLYLADPSVFHIFSYSLVEGDVLTALSKPMQAVITANVSKRLFGEASAIGKVVKVNNKPVLITGILADVPFNTHLRFEVLLSFSSLPTFGGDTTSWQGNNNYTYLLLKNKGQSDVLNAKLATFAKGRLKHENLVAQNVSDIHLKSNRAFEPDVNGDSKTVDFLQIVAILIVLIGCINYINLITANASRKSKESGMRKLLGSSKAALVARYLTETLVVNIFAFAFALLIVQLAYPNYQDLTGRDFGSHIFNETEFWFRFAALFLLVVLASGTYPAFILSSVKPATVIRRSFTQAASGNLFRRALVVGQFTVAIVVLIASTLIYKQVRFMRNHDMGMNSSQLLILKGPLNADSDSLHGEKIRSFVNELKQLAPIGLVAISEAVPGENFSQLNTTTGITRYGSNEESGYNYCNYDIDDQFIAAMQMDIIAGRNFRVGDLKNDVILNEEACRLLGFKTPQEAIGEKISYAKRGYKYSTVVGVLKDYKQRSAKESMVPMIHTYHQLHDSYYTVSVNTADLAGTITAIGKTWKQNYPENAFQYFFLDDLIDRQYKSDLQFGRIIGIFSGLTFFITCLGILGLTAATISRRTREIGVRKVLGASVGSIVSLISSDFITLVCVSILIASPIAWLLMNEWLRNYHTRIDIGWSVFAFAGILAITVAVITISFQAVRAATANPVNSLKAD